MVTRDYRRLHGVTKSHKGYKLLQGVKGLHRVTRANGRLQMVTRDKGGLQRVAGGYKGLEGVRRGYKESQGLQGVTVGEGS